MQLAIDIGNSYIKVGLFDGEKLVKTTKHETLDDPLFQNIINQFDISHAIVSSVELPEIEKAIRLKSETKLVKFDHNTKLPIKNNYLSPETLGKDRIAAAIGGWKLNNMSSVLVIDAGTCVKYDFADHDSGYMGGSISPGLQMRLDAMHEFTARLPLLKLEQTADFYGKDTFSAMMTGVMTGIIGECKYFIDLFETRFGKINVILTGGNADFISLHLNKKYQLEPNLVLFGLNSILKHNLKND